ncbi:MAG: hypothetical protein GTN36_01160 [Candidatus Aenigmarchaeota archaeon]|nr:hypothetical protein [Candidatus Aenigmarchaeota archaeon]
MKGLKGIAPAIAIIAILAAAGIGVGAPVAMASMQHSGDMKLTPVDAPYGIMRAGEAIMGAFQPDKGAWNGELIRVREMERTELQKRCPECKEQIQQLEQEQVRIRQQEQERVATESQTQTGTGKQTGTGSQGGQGQGG